MSEATSSQQVTSRERRQNFISHVTASHKSFDLLELERPTSFASDFQGNLSQQGSSSAAAAAGAVTRDRCNSLGSPTCDSSLIETTSIGLVSKSPFLLKSSNFNVRPTPFVSSGTAPLTVAAAPPKPLLKQQQDPVPAEISSAAAGVVIDTKPAVVEILQESSRRCQETPPPQDTEKLFEEICEKPEPPKACVRQTSVLTTVLQAPQLSMEKTITVDVSKMDLGNSLADAASGSVNGDTITVNVPKLSPIIPNGAAVAPVKKESDPLGDPWCDPASPKKVQFQDISAAAFKIKSGIMMTPCTRSHLSSMTGMEIFFKKDFLQYTGSFKERGARYTLLMLPPDQQKQGVIAASAGNHALALSYHGQDLGVPVTVVMPIVAPIMKVQSCRQFGANIIIHGRDIGESKEHAMKIAREKNLTYINGYDHPHIIAGQGTMGLEIVEQVKNVDAVVVPVGGGGLIAGVALAVKSLYPHIQIIGVESERCTSFGNALRAKQPIYTKADSTLADGLAVPKVGVNALETAAPLVDKCIAVKEEYIAMAILRLVEIEKAVVEGAGACGLAAILAGLLPELKGKRVVVCLCGGNIDTTVLGRCLERGLAVDGRLVKFSVTVSDRPGGIAELCRLLANMGVSIKDILHERAWLKSDIFSVEVRVMCETRDLEQAIELERVLKEHYNSVHFGTACDMASGYLNDMFSSHTPMHT